MKIKKPDLTSALNIALSQITTLKVLESTHARLQGEIQAGQDDKARILREQEIGCNNALIGNATNVLRELLADKNMKEYVESVIGKHDGSPLSENDIYVTLAEEKDTAVEQGEHNRPLGTPCSKNKFQLVLRVHRCMKRGYKWNLAEIQYVMYSINNILIKDWMDAVAVNLPPEVAHALLYMQTPKTALSLLTSVLGNEHTVGHKERKLLKIRVPR